MRRPRRTDDGASSYRVMNCWHLQGAVGRPGLLCIEALVVGGCLSNLGHS